jgi:uncharacterized protein YjbI with pentapeptide repeats
MPRLGSRLTKGPLTFILAFILGSSVTGLAVAGATGALTSSNNVYAGCLKHGTLSNIKVNATLTCHGGARVISWNAQGVQGIQGVKGIQGVQGVQGVPGPTTQVCSARFPGADLAGCNLTGANLTGESYDNLTGANLTDANLHNANLDGTDLCTANLTGIQSGGINPAVAYFTCGPWGIYAPPSDPTNGYLVGPTANLAGATLTGVSAGFQDFAGANLTNADLTNADLDNTDLDGANLDGANATNANFDAATTTGATIVGVTWVNTTCPDGTNSDTDGFTCVGYGF